MAYHTIPARLQKFADYCKSKNIEILVDDLRFIDRTLANSSQGDLRAILLAYLEKWYEGMEKAQSSQEEQFLGRRQANLWLLEKYND